MAASEQSLVLVDGLECLVLYTSFTDVRNLIHNVKDAASLHEAVVVFSVSMEALETSQQKHLQRELKVLPVVSVRKTTIRIPTDDVPLEDLSEMAPLDD